MSRKSGRQKRVSLFDHGNVFCPICLTGFTRHQVSSGKEVTLEHVPIKALGGKDRCLTCEDCNNQAGRGVDQAAAVNERDSIYGTADILGKLGTVTLSPDGKTVISSGGRYTEQDIQNLKNSESGEFTLSFKIPDPISVSTSSLKSAYLALFSLLGPNGGYFYAHGDAVTPIRQQIMNPIQDNSVRKYVTGAPDDKPLGDILLISKPLPCWIVKVSKQLVFLPLCGDDGIGQPLFTLRNLNKRKSLSFVSPASWPFVRFGTFSTVGVHLVGADSVNSVFGLSVHGQLPNGRWREGICINQLGESATLLCSDSIIDSAGLNLS